MAESTQWRDRAVPQAAEHAPDATNAGTGSKIRRLIVRSIFWSYERGSWQYDIICLLILGFIFLSGSWTGDRPAMQLSDLRHVQGVVETGHGKGWRSYQIDARVVESLAPEKPEDAVREILQSNLQGAFKVKSVAPIKDKKNGKIILGYTVVVEP